MNTINTNDALQDQFNRNLVYDLEISIQPSDQSIGSFSTLVENKGGIVSESKLIGIERKSGKHLYTTRLFVANDDQRKMIEEEVQRRNGMEILSTSDIAMQSHQGGACKMVASYPIRSNTDLRLVYTPGVARVCRAIQNDLSLADTYTGINNTVAIVTNGTAILGLGDIGPIAGMPVMEGKSAIFAEFAQISAIPILVDTKDPERFIDTVCTIAPTFGAIQVEDVAAPECFHITRELDRRINKPVMHDDQYGTATIVLAGLYSALQKTNKKIETLRVCILGAGAAGTAIADLLLKAGVADVVLCDRRGVISRDRDDLNSEKQSLLDWTNRNNVSGDLKAAIRGTDLFIGCSGPNLVSRDMIVTMNSAPLVFALANPVSEISREDAIAAGAAIYADGRIMNNALAYPGIFRGALDSKATAITIKMMQAAAKALASIVTGDALLPEMMDARTHQTVAQAVQQAV